MALYQQYYGWDFARKIENRSRRTKGLPKIPVDRSTWALKDVSVSYPGEIFSAILCQYMYSKKEGKFKDCPTCNQRIDLGATCKCLREKYGIKFANSEWIKLCRENRKIVSVPVDPRGVETGKLVDRICEIKRDIQKDDQEDDEDIVEEEIKETKKELEEMLDEEDKDIKLITNRAPVFLIEKDVAPKANITKEKNEKEEVKKKEEAKKEEEDPRLRQEAGSVLIRRGGRLVRARRKSARFRNCCMGTWVDDD
jgi:hypothetical protein